MQTSNVEMMVFHANHLLSALLFVNFTLCFYLGVRVMAFCNSQLIVFTGDLLVGAIIILDVME